ncbi:hypothetical protein NX801_18790 [Streptomyces sp. LP05-1]|uniref:Integral membrane protein n=1 Tax=Streptomyces pyxinae TaxID=2970734 RepID=A0ABT2CJT7_9ACTN|nr:hypothetical protein [Streptomyces sp. LP05-1]MCS0637674.1 hypothetical protein [Streptomyces sp. LP05-1]
MAGRRISLLALALVTGGVWWWAVLRLALAPQHAGVVEATLAAGGWGLSLLPVHVAAARAPRRARLGQRVELGTPDAAGAGVRLRESGG